jgi:hypothetical protein
MKIKYIILSLTAFLLLMYFNIQSNMTGTFELEGENKIDSIYLFPNTLYKRVYITNNVKYEVFGSWYKEDNHITFSNWDNRNQILDMDLKNGESVCFSLGRKFLSIDKIYFDHNKYHYYLKLK